MEHRRHSGPTPTFFTCLYTSSKVAAFTPAALSVVRISVVMALVSEGALSRPPLLGTPLLTRGQPWQECQHPLES